MHHILLAEDSDLIIRHLQLLLVKSGHRVSVARTKTEALELLTQHRFQYALLDIKFHNDHDGLDIAKAARQAGETKIIFISAYSDQRTMALAKELDPLAYLLKPIDEAQLLQLLK